MGGRGRRGLHWSLIGIALFILLAIATPFLVPISGFIPELERIASEKLGQPVSIDELRLHPLPTPRMVANGIAVGRKMDLTIGELEIVPDVTSFVSGARSIRLIQAERVYVRESALAIPKGMPKSQGGEPIFVRRLVLKEVNLQHSKLRVPQFDADVALGEGFSLERALLETRDGSMKLELDASKAFTFTAKQWILPAGAPLKFDALAVQGTLKGEQLDLTKIEGLLYGGKIAGTARASWTKQWQVTGNAKLAGVDLVPVQQAFGKPAKLSGRLKADAAFSSRAKAANQLGNALMLDGPFEVEGGAYQGVDLSKAGDITGKPAAGDATSFEELRGLLQMRGKQVKINRLCVRSPKVVAGGNVEIAPDQKLSGKLDISVAKTGGFVGVPVSLGGTTSDPSVTPTRGYVIGAVIGTVLLPGIGTSIGSSIGSRIEGTSDCK
ncbi:MAG: hypothetical protein EPO20_21935 [Betaproteobacteria bacterium]|nr:MAG: hypothetical protein EPO20_21935 [Betaproteobacteria bacterium]